MAKAMVNVRIPEWRFNVAKAIVYVIAFSVKMRVVSFSRAETACNALCEWCIRGAKVSTTVVA